MESQAISMDIMIKLSAKGLFSIIFKQRQWKITIHVHLSIRQVRVKENTTTSKWIWFHISRNPQGSVARTGKGWPSSSEGRRGLLCEWSPSFRFWTAIQLMVQKCGQPVDGQFVPLAFTICLHILDGAGFAITKINEHPWYLQRISSKNKHILPWVDSFTPGKESSYPTHGIQEIHPPNLPIEMAGC